MAKKLERKNHEPGWGEVILGAALSVVLGVVLGAVSLIFKPVEVVKEPPKEPVAGMTYFVEGARDTAKAKQAAAKRKAFAQGSSGVYSIVEDEINVLAGPATPAATPAASAKAKPGEKAAPAPAAAAPAAPAENVTAGTPNFRIRTGTIQIGFPVTLSAMGAEFKVMVQAQGNFVKKDAMYVFQPDSMLVGSCPVQRLPYASGYVTKKFLAAQVIAEDIAASWPKLTNVAVDGNVLKLTMP